MKLCGVIKKNCWEFKKCGRELGGERTNELGICPTSLETRLEGVHGGKNAGRSCWVVAGTLCGDEIQGEFARKYESCFRCDFYKKVKEEEGKNYKFSIYLLKLLNGRATVIIHDGKENARLITSE